MHRTDPKGNKSFEIATMHFGENFYREKKIGPTLTTPGFEKREIIQFKGESISAKIFLFIRKLGFFQVFNKLCVIKSTY